MTGERQSAFLGALLEAMAAANISLLAPGGAAGGPDAPMTACGAARGTEGAGDGNEGVKAQHGAAAAGPVG